MTAWARRAAGGWLLAVHARPGAKRTEIAGLHGDALKIRLAAPALENRANEALVAFLAEALGVSRKSVSVIKGRTSREKLVIVGELRADPLALLGVAQPSKTTLPPTRV